MIKRLLIILQQRKNTLSLHICNSQKKSLTCKKDDPQSSTVKRWTMSVQSRFCHFSLQRVRPTISESIFLLSQLSLQPPPTVPSCAFVFNKAGEKENQGVMSTEVGNIKDRSWIYWACLCCSAIKFLCWFLAKRQKVGSLHCPRNKSLNYHNDSEAV